MASATEIVFLPGFDGVAELRDEFIKELSRHHPARAVGYPNRKLESLDGYSRHVAQQVARDARPVVIAESFSGLVAARWAATDPRVVALALCGAFARSPSRWSALGASLPSTTRFLAASFMNPFGFVSKDPGRREWSQGLSSAIASLDREVIRERLHLVASEDASGDLAALGIPIVIVQFESDLVIGRAASGHLESVCHNAKVVRIPGPHFAIETRPRQSAQAIAVHLAAFFDNPANEK